MTRIREWFSAKWEWAKANKTLVAALFIGLAAGLWLVFRRSSASGSTAPAYATSSGGGNNGSGSSSGSDSALISSIEQQMSDQAKAEANALTSLSQQVTASQAAQGQVFSQQLQQLSQNWAASQQAMASAIVQMQQQAQQAQAQMEAANQQGMSQLASNLGGAIQTLQGQISAQQTAYLQQEQASQVAMANLVSQLNQVQTRTSQAATLATQAANSALNTNPAASYNGQMYQGPASNISWQTGGGSTAATADLSQKGVVIVDNPSYGSAAQREALYQHNIAASGGGG